MPELTTNRLSIYLSCLDEVAHQGVRTVSSTALAQRFDLNAALHAPDAAR